MPLAKYLCLTAITIALFLCIMEITLRIVPEKYWLQKTLNEKIKNNVEAKKNNPSSQAKSESDESQIRSRNNHKIPDNQNTRKMKIPDHADKELLKVHIPLEKGYNISGHGEFSVTFSINSHGLRDVEIPWEKPINAVRIILYGDSFVEAFQVRLEDTFGKQLEALLESNTGKAKYGTINAGMSGYTPMLYYLHYSKRAFKYRPDIVIMFYNGRQALGDQLYVKYATFDENGMPLRCTHPALKEVQQTLLDQYYNYLKANLKLINFVEIRVNMFFAKLRMPGSVKSSINAVNYSNRKEMWETSFHILKGFRMKVKEKGGVLIVAYLPSRMEMEEIADIKKAGLGYDTHPDASVISNFCKENGFPFIDLSPYLEKWHDKPIFFVHDGHLTRAGHRAVANALYEFLTQMQ